jgi:hypothetical protein
MALQHPLVDIEDETDWLIQLMNVCQHSFSKTENPGMLCRLNVTFDTCH